MIKLVKLLQESRVSEDMIKQLALEMGETIVSSLGSGINGTAYETESGKVLKYTQDTYEVGLATRLRKKRLYKHIINVYDVRPIENLAGSYLILMDKVSDWRDDINKAKQWEYIRNEYFGNKMTDKQLLEWIIQNDESSIQFDMDFINKIIQQRSGIKRDFSELRIFSDEAHAGNMGWNKHGNLVHFDAWQNKHYSETVYYKQKKNAKPGDTIWGATHYTQDINNTPYEKGLNKPLQSFKNRNN